MTDAAILPGWTLAYSGKVRDLYTSPDRAGEVLMVASDRVSAFDHVLQPGIPGKGELLTTLSLWWFGQLADIPNHLASPGVESLDLPDSVARRAMLARNLDMYPVECVVRGYLSGSGWLEYQASQSVCGIALPAGLRDGDRLPEPIYTPAWKAPLGEHDENITFERTVELVGADVATSLRESSLEIFRRASDVAESRGVLLADTKFEFGADRQTGELTLGDEVLTSDSSRYWDAAVYAAGGDRRLESFDKQIVRNWLKTNWDPAATASAATPPPALPDDIVARTAARYRELIDRLTGE
ncbi:MAG: phosphoribosylaminoimidazolesuccinocarboxamide synthase [Microbacteriaceae bacterium]|jgi:phosphoribosylaminoimidazole-succinocarboxamide synthase|nr:phosphoribosylaminoimidazolesuccinocarboxamide synthase [Microbacteriaceae bacterium]